MFWFTVQYSSVAQSCPTLYDPMNRSTPGLPVCHQLLESTQTQNFLYVQISYPYMTTGKTIALTRWTGAHKTTIQNLSLGVEASPGTLSQLGFKIAVNMGLFTAIQIWI